MYRLSSQLEKNPAVLEPFEQGVEKTLKGNYLGRSRRLTERC